MKQAARQLALPVSSRPVTTAEDLVDFKKLLDQAGLPVSDIGQRGQFLFLFSNGNNIVGTGGYERHSDAALIRSISVTPQEQGNGYGRIIVTDLMKMAHSTGAGSAYLLTTSASEFFAAMGFRKIERHQAPDAIRSSTEFSSVCPASAVLMPRVF